MDLYLGVESGEGRLRAALVDPSLQVVAHGEDHGLAADMLGLTAGAQRLQRVMRAVLVAAPGSEQHLMGVGVGLADAAHHEGWLRTTVAALLPKVPCFAASALDVALIGAHGQRLGVLVMAGAGSLAYGVDAGGMSALAGGWGYLIGDEGSRYWIGRRALEAVSRAMDGRARKTGLTLSLLEALDLRQPRDLIGWLYRPEQIPVHAIARLAPLVLDAAESDLVARRIVEAAAQELAHLVETVSNRLALDAPPIAFAGDLLSGPNRLSTRLAHLLGYAEPPLALYPPTVGAALLAKLALEEML